ncbi:MAG TPA: Ig-like domain-containing protein [Frankiaceae bacterium]|jgi:VCBS repeat-containing protein|nr:Ig-like domain-containing protein [Frankiaceae bacterium]
MPQLRVASRLSLAIGLLVGWNAPAYAAVSPQGDVAAAWPAAWSTYRTATGDPILDVLGDENPDNSDLSSGPCSGSGCTGTSPTVYYASDGTTAFFRTRLAVDPSDATKGGLTGNAYLTQIAVGGTVVAVAGVDGKSASVDYVYVASAPGTTVTQIYTWPFTSPSNGMRVVSDGAGQWFLDYQVPIARLTTISGGAITATTPIQLYYGSSAAANLATLNKDLMRGSTSTVSFTGLATVSLSPSTLSATSAATRTSGPSPTEGQTSRYTVTLTATNGGGGELSGAVATATLPAGVTYVSGGTGVSASGSTVTWNAGLLLPGETDTVTFVVDLVPASGTSGSNVPLLSAVSVTGTDVGTSSARSASAPALTVGPVAAPPPGNVAPVAADDTLTAAEDGSGSVNVLTNDGDANGDALTVTVTGAPAHGSMSVSGGVVTYTPTADYNGPDSFTYTVCDPSNACDTATVTVTVTAANDAPIAADDALTATEDGSGSVNVLTNDGDADGDALTVTVTGAPAHGTTSVAGGVVTYTPAADYSGPDSFTYTVCDASDACDTATVTVTVTAANDAPGGLASTGFTTDEDTPHSGTLPTATDPDGDALTYSAATQPDHGSVTVNANGTYTYTPDPNYAGGDSFTYRACDADAACVTATATVTVTPVNDAPGPLAGTSFTTAEDTPHDGTLPAATDPDGDALTYSAGTQPAHGSVTVDAGGSYTYTPDPDYSGPDSFTYRACDAAPLCSTATATVTVTPVNDAPGALAGTTFSTPEDTPHDGTLPTTTDPDGDALTYSAATQPAHGSVTVNADGTYTYTPDPDYAGPDSFTYQVCDAAPLCSTATATVTVTPVNDSPGPLAGTAFTTPEDTPHDGSLPAGSDPDGDALTYSVVTQPAHGSVTVNADGTYTYTPDPNYAGSDSFTYQVCDAAPLCATATATVTVSPVNDPPAAPAATSFSTPAGTAHDGTLPGSTDPDGDALTHSVLTGPAHGTVVVAPGGTYTYTPAPGYVGGDSFTYQVCDPSNACASATATVTVTAVPPPNVAPVANDDVATVTTGTTAPVDVLANDADTDTLTITATSTPANGGTVAVLPGSLTYTPAAGFVGTDTFTYTVCDPSNECDTATVTVTVLALPPVNKPPVADAGKDVSTLAGNGVTLDGTGSSDPDGDTLTYAWTQVGGVPVTLAGATTATPSFTVPKVGSYVFVLTVSDGLVTSTDTVTVFGGLQVVDFPAPSCPDVTIANTGSGVTVPLGCDTVDDGTTVAVVDGPAHGDAEVLDDGTVNYVPDPGWTGADRFTVRVCNGDACEDVLVTVLERTVRRPSRLPNTGSGADVLVPVAFVLVVLGAASYRRGVRA